MLLKIYQYIRGYVRIRITGHRMERFINACNYRKIKIWDLSASDGSYEMNLWVKDFKKLRHISHKTSTKITPFALSLSISSFVKCKPAVGAAALPSILL